MRPFLFSSLMYFSCYHVRSELPELSINCSRTKRFILSEFANKQDSLSLSKLVISVPSKLSELASSANSFILNSNLAASLSTFIAKLYLEATLLGVQFLLIRLLRYLHCSWPSLILNLIVSPNMFCWLIRIINSVKWYASWFCHIDLKPIKPIWLQIEFAVDLANSNLFLIKI